MKFMKWIKKLTIVSSHPSERVYHQSEGEQLTGLLQEDFNKIKQMFTKTFDFSYRMLEVPSGYTAAILYLDGLVDKKRMEVGIIDPLLRYKEASHQRGFFILDDIKELLRSVQIQQGNTVQEVVEQILSGSTVILINGFAQSLFIPEQSWPQRAIEEPPSEAVVIGPREGFIENIRANISMIRRRIKTPQLKLENVKIGKISKTDVAIIYIEGIAQSSIVEEVKNRINRINIDAIESSGSILEFIQDHPFSVFPQILHTERPDRVVGSLLEGRVAILVDNTPFALVVPINFFLMMNSPEDYYGHFILASFIRLLRYLFLLIALLFPSIYIAVTSFHQELLPTNLLFSVTSSREQVPFPAIVEALLMEITFEALREAGLRLPRPIGSTISIVGALVIGQAAVQAGIVSAPLVIVVSVTGIASFMFPSYGLTGAIRLLRFLMMLLAALLGFYGILLGVFFILAHLVELRSFGVPYMEPVAPFNFNNLKDVFVRVPWWKMDERPFFVGKKNLKRLSSSANISNRKK